MLAIFCVSFLYMVAAESQTQGAFLNNLNSYQNICREIGWAPKCQKEHIKNRAVAFHAYLQTSIASLAHNQILKYDHVVTNIGGGYNKTTGKFTAPVDGIYSFSWTHMTKKGGTCEIGGMVDGHQFARSAVYDQMATWQTTTANLVIQLKKGSKFWTQNTIGLAACRKISPLVTREKREEILDAKHSVECDVFENGKHTFPCRIS